MRGVGEQMLYLYFVSEPDALADFQEKLVIILHD